jgi:hypothetical protein
MERVALIVEDSNERIDCLLNPDNLVVRRQAGLRVRDFGGGPLSGGGRRDDPLIHTGGGRTEMEVDLLFDISLVRTPPQPADVRELTHPIWNLAENQPAQGGHGEVSRLRFIWGRHWNFPCVVDSIAERLEQFQRAGAPRRSWLRMRLLRVDDTALDQVTRPDFHLPEGMEDVRSMDAAGGETGPGANLASAPEAEMTTVISTGERLDVLAYLHYGRAAAWRLIAWFNRITDPLAVSEGTILRLPPLDMIRTPRGPKGAP